MILKRNVLVLALASAGLCLTVGAQAAPSTPANGNAAAPSSATPQDTSGSTPPVATTATDKKKKTTDTSKETDDQKLAKSLGAISVTGFSKSIESSIDYQRYSDTITNVVTAADIGGLPDQSIADALTRLPGVAAERISGQDSQINVRGLDGNFVLTTLDGREQPSTSGSNYTQFDQYPSELINMATVYKSSQASLIEGGVGATIDMGTANPLDNPKEQSLNVDARGSYDGQAHDVTGAGTNGYRFSAAYQGKFLNDTLGVGFGVAQLYQPHVSEQFVGEAYNSSPAPINSSPGAPSAYIPEGIQLQQQGGEERRTGYLGTVVWKPDDHLQITGDTFFSKFDNTGYGYGFRSQNFYNGNAQITNPTIAPNGALLGGTVSSNPDPSNYQFSNETTADNYTTDTNVFSGGLNLKWNDGPWHIEADASMSRAFSDEINVDATADPYVGLGTATPTLMPQSLTYMLNGGRVGTVSFANPGIYTNLNDMALSHYGVYPYVYHDRTKAFRTSVKYDLLNNSVFSAIEAGVYVNNHTYDADRSIYQYGQEWGENAGTQTPLLLNNSDAVKTCWQGTFGSFPCFLKLNGPAILAANGITQTTPLKDWNNSWTLIQSGSVNEKVRDFFVMADIDATLLDHELTGNVGMRVSHTSQYASGIQEVDNNSGVPIADGYGVINDNFKPITLGKTYTDYLPSLNLAYHLSDSDQVRFSAAKVLSRPPVNLLMAGAGAYYTNGNTYNVYGGTSPLLNPLRARQYDLTYEHYFEDSSGIVSADVFFKHIDSFAEQVTYNNFDFASVGITVPTNPATGTPYLNGEYQAAYNAPGGDLRGIETDFQKTHFLPGALAGLGFQASYAYTQNNTKAVSTLGGPPQEQSLPGYSRKVASAALFYDYGPFSTRLSINYRSPFVSDSQIAVTNQIVYFGSETVMDYQASYNFTKNLSGVFQMLNLTNQPTRTYFGNPAETGTIQYFGRTAYIGVSLKL